MADWGGDITNVCVDCTAPAILPAARADPRRGRRSHPVDEGVCFTQHAHGYPHPHL